MKKILVIEDVDDIREMLVNSLGNARYKIDTATYGVKSYDCFSKKQYDMILLDIMLPKIDGYGVYELIRKDSTIPIIMITALDSEEDQIRGLDK